MTAGPRRRRLPAAERRETILRAASEVFAESGYRAAKVSDVAARVGVTEPVVFQNFGSKAALFAAVIERAAAEVLTALDALPAAGGQPAGLLAHVLAGGAHGHAAARHSPHDHAPGAGAGMDTAPAGLPNAGAAYAVLFSDATELAADPEAAAPARDALRAVAAHLADLIRHDGSTRQGTDPEAAAWLLLSVLATRRLRAAVMPPHLEPDVTALLLTALAPPPVPADDQLAHPERPRATPSPPRDSRAAGQVVSLPGNRPRVSAPGGTMVPGRWLSAGLRFGLMGRR